MRQYAAEIIANAQIATGYFELTFLWPEEGEAPRPGQFISLKSYGITDLILRRPFAVSAFDAAKGEARIVYQIKGEATRALAGRLAGERLDVIGPLGNTFPAPNGARPVLVGGGVGLGPILYHGNTLAAQGERPLVVLGFRGASLIPELASRCRFEPVLCTDDGSVGHRGTVVDYLRGLPRDGLSGGELYVCGPNPMMAGCHSLAADLDLACWVSMEQIMGCGVGACMGCAIPIAGSAAYARVCTEGPVFPSRMVAWTSL